MHTSQLFWGGHIKFMAILQSFFLVAGKPGNTWKYQLKVDFSDKFYDIFVGKHMETSNKTRTGFF